MRMTGSTSCCRKRTYGLPLQPGVLLQRRSQNRSSAKSGAGCRPSIIDLQAALQRSIHTLHLLGASLQDDLVKMKVFVPQGVTCFSGATFDCTSSFENWQMVLREEGRRIYPGRNPDTMIFHRVHKAIEEVCPNFEPAVKHFILADTEEQEHTRTVVFAIFTSRFEFFGACHWTPTTRVWDILDLCGGERGWVIYHNNQRLRHQRVSVYQEDFFACYERGDCTILLADHITTDIAQGWVANSPSPMPRDAAESATVAPTVFSCPRIAAWLYVSTVWAVALLSALTK